MEKWFGKSIEQPFYIFSAGHILMLIIYAVALLILLMGTRKIRKHPNIYQLLRWTFFTLLICSEISYQIWALLNGVWNLREHIPLHLCGIASILAMISLLTQNKKLIQITFFIGVIPPLLALITPVLPHDYHHFRFWKFFIHHIVISLASVFLVIGNRIELRLKAIGEAFAYLILYAIVIGFIVNPLLNSNYLYLAYIPLANTPLQFLGEGFWYYINLGLAALASFFLLYAIHVFSIKLKKRRYKN